MSLIHSTCKVCNNPFYYIPNPKAKRPRLRCQNCAPLGIDVDPEVGPELEVGSERDLNRFAWDHPSTIL